MYIIMTYDVNAKRVVRVLKAGRRYLSHVQNSVLEGELSPGQFRSLQRDVKRIIEKEDAVLFYTLQTGKYLCKVQLGLPSRQIDNVV